MPPRRRTKPKKRPDMIGIPDDPGRFDQAVRAFEKRIPFTREEWESLLEEERRFAFTVADVAKADLVTEVYEAIGRAVRDGTDLETFKAEVGDKLEKAWGGEDPARLETIFRTNVQTALNEGRYAIFTAPAVKKSRPYWRWEAIDDDRIDDECAPLVDLIVPADDPWWSSHLPPLHFNCRCTITALDQEEVDEEGSGRLDEPPDVDAAPGFGAAPDEPGEDWQPDPSRYPDPIGRALEKRISR